MTPRPTIHATCVVVGEAGVLIRGPSGSGKSGLAAEIADLARLRGKFAALVADDRVRLEPVNGRLVASCPPAIAGLIERRGVGIVQADHWPEAVVRLVVDIEAAPARMPENRSTEVNGVTIARIAVATDLAGAANLVIDCLKMARPPLPCDPNALAFAPQHGKMRVSASQTPTVRTDRDRAACGGQIPERKDFCAETA